jgi:hypothetical protein
MDPRFRGWGSEDVSFMRAVDCLYAPHKSTPNCVFHLWHPKIGTVWPTRRWEGQDEPRTNEHLGMRYRNAMGDRERMRALGSEWQGERDDDERKQLLPKSRGRGRHRRN